VIVARVAFALGLTVLVPACGRLGYDAVGTGVGGGPASGAGGGDGDGTGGGARGGTSGNGRGGISGAGHSGDGWPGGGSGEGGSRACTEVGARCWQDNVQSWRLRPEVHDRPWLGPKVNLTDAGAEDIPPSDLTVR
jgi:hypothetical protein